MVILICNLNCGPKYIYHPLFSVESRGISVNRTAPSRLFGEYVACSCCTSAIARCSSFQHVQIALSAADLSKLLLIFSLWIQKKLAMFDSTFP